MGTRIIQFWCFEKKNFLTESWKPILNFSFISLRGCWGQPRLLFWKLLDETQMPTTPEATSYHGSRKSLDTPQSHLESFISLWDSLYYIIHIKRRKVPSHCGFPADWRMKVRSLQFLINALKFNFPLFIIIITASNLL